jgi:hypothetical protein
MSSFSRKNVYGGEIQQLPRSRHMLYIATLYSEKTLETWKTSTLSANLFGAETEKG